MPTTDFISTWYVPHDNSTIRLPIPSAVTVSVSWGDGSGYLYSDTTDVSHVYATQGNKTITVSGPLVWDVCGAGATIGDLVKETIRDISQCGRLVIGNSGEQFIGCHNLTWTAVDAPNTNGVDTMLNCFYNCASLNVVPPKFDTSAVTNFTNMFYGTKVFNRGFVPAISNLTDRSWYLPDASYVRQMIPNSDVSALRNYTTIPIDLSSYAVVTAGGNSIPVNAPASTVIEGAQSGIAAISVQESLIRRV